MPGVAARLRSRRLGEHRADPAPSPGRGLRTLAEAPTGDRVRIVALRDDGDAAVTRRLFDLGFAPGAAVDVLRRAPLGDPMVFRVAGYDIALRRAQASCIVVVGAG
jgi:ferrous iron transport protein A